MVTISHYYLSELGSADRAAHTRAKAAVLDLQRPGLCETRTLRWREPDSNHRSLSYGQYPEWLGKRHQSFVRMVSRDACAPVKCAGGTAILTIEWLELDGDRCHARTLYRNHARRE